MERLTPTEPPVLTPTEELVLEFAGKVGLAFTREDQQDLVHEFTVKSMERGLDIDWNFLLPPQVIDEP